MDYLNDHIYLTFLLGITWGIIITFVYFSIYDLIKQIIEKKAEKKWINL